MSINRTIMKLLDNAERVLKLLRTHAQKRCKHERKDSMYTSDGPNVWCCDCNKMLE